MTARVVVWHVVSEMINQRYTAQDILTFLENVNKIIKHDDRNECGYSSFWSARK